MAKDLKMKSVDENDELTLELSIGGIFGKSDRNMGESAEKVGPPEAMNVQSKRQIHVLRRRELRRKREEKLKKSVGFGSGGSVSGPFMENKEWLETQIVERSDAVFENEPARKKERIGSLPENNGSIPNISPPFTNGFVNHKVTSVCGGDGQVVARIDEGVKKKNSIFRPTACRSFRPYEANTSLKPIVDEIEGGGGPNVKVNSNGSAGCSSSAFSDSQGGGGGCTDDSRSNSSNSQLDQQLPTTSAASEPSEQPTESSKPTVSINNSTVREPGPLKPSNAPESSGRGQQASLARMPCVSTTGNGPNGKTISGFLYRYTKNEVSIVCVCHGRSFSPAGFVEHAGGVDIVNPLKHITILPTAFAS